METSEALFFKNGQEWRTWLQQCHAEKNAVWLIHYNKSSGKTGITYDEALEEALCFGWIDGKMKSLDDEKYIIRYSPRKARSVWSKLNKEKAEQLIASGRMTYAGLAKIKAAKNNGYWDSAYTNRVTDELPLDLKKALILDKDAWYHFQGFANSYRNTYIGWVTMAKSDETRKRRISEVVKRSSMNKKPGME